MKNTIALSISVIFVLMQSCHHNSLGKASSRTSASNTNYHKIDFIKFITERKDDTVDFYEGFLLDTAFVNVFEHGDFYKNDVNEFLNTGHFSYPQVAVCICAMQNLSVTDYVKFCNIVLSLYNTDKVTWPLLEHAICPDFLHKRTIIDNYDNPQVAALLQSIQNDKKVTNKDFRKWLPDIISGKSSKELKQFDEDSGEASY